MKFMKIIKDEDLFVVYAISSLHSNRDCSSISKKYKKYIKIFLRRRMLIYYQDTKLMIV